MAYEVIWSQESLSDIGDIAAYINRDSPFHARRVVEECFALGDELVEQPKAGRVVPEFQIDTVRERQIYSYRMIYELKEEQIHILGVIHGARQLEEVKRFT